MPITTSSDRVVFNEFQRALSSDMNKLQAAAARNVTEVVGRNQSQRTFLNFTTGATERVSYNQIITSGLEFSLSGPTPGADIEVSPGSAMIKLIAPLGDMGGDYALATQREPILLTVPPADIPAVNGFYLGRLTVPVNTVDTLFQTRDIFDPATGTFSPTPGTPVESEVQFDWGTPEWDFFDLTTTSSTGFGINVAPPAVGDDKVIIGVCGWITSPGYTGWIQNFTGTYTPTLRNLNAEGLTAPRHTWTIGSDGSWSIGGEAWTPYRGVFNIQPLTGPAALSIETLITDSNLAVADDTKYEIWGYAGTDQDLCLTTTSTNAVFWELQGGASLTFGAVFATDGVPKFQAQGVNGEPIGDPVVGGPYPPGSCVYLGSAYREPPNPLGGDSLWIGYTEQNGEGSIPQSDPLLYPALSGKGEPFAAGAFSEWDLAVSWGGVYPLGVLVRRDVAPVYPALGYNSLRDTVGPPGTLDELQFTANIIGRTDTLLNIASQNNLWVSFATTSQMLPVAPFQRIEYASIASGCPVGRWSIPFALRDMDAGNECWALVGVPFAPFVGNTFAGCDVSITGWKRTYTNF